MKNMIWFSVVFAVNVVAALLVYFFAPNVEEFWFLWLLSTGLVLGRVLSRGTSVLPYGIALGLTGGVLLAFLIRSLPVHSLGWEQARKIVIHPTERRDQWAIEITKPEDLELFIKYGRKGRYGSLLRPLDERTQGPGHDCTLVVYWEKQQPISYYVIKDAVGEASGQPFMTVFYPSEAGFFDHVERLMRKYRK